jgi:hypothetical protein
MLHSDGGNESAHLALKRLPLGFDRNRIEFRVGFLIGGVDRLPRDRERGQ